VTDPNTSTELWSATGTYTAGNRIATFAGCSYAHDGNGNIIRRVCGADSTRYYWDGDAQLTSFKRSGADSVTCSPKLYQSVS